MDDNTQTPETKKEDAPKVQTFTQAENDRLVGQAIVKERQKYADYNDTKQQLEALLSEKKEREMANKTELEKIQAAHSEVLTELTNAKNELSTYQKEKVRNSVLDGSKYRGLPRAYKNLVSLSDNAEEVMAAADKVLEEYQNDTGKKVAETFGIPEQQDTTISEPAKAVANPSELAASLRQKVLGAIKNNNRG